MPVVPMREILDRAFPRRYGVAAINVVDDLSLEAVLAAATDLASAADHPDVAEDRPSIGSEAHLRRCSGTPAADVPVPVTLHLDHCPDREWISTCLRTGWNSVLFDGSELDVEENTRQTIEVVAEADGYGAQVEGEIESVLGVEDGVGPTSPATCIPSRSRTRSSRRRACTRSRPRSAPRTASTRPSPS